jgi:hypothetical protein
LIDEAAQALRRVHGCHTVILYGSYARGDWNDESDLDIAGFAPRHDGYRIAGPWRGGYLDAFIYPERKLDEGEPTDLMHLRVGSVLVDDLGRGRELLERLQTLHPETGKLPPGDATVRRRWAWKMLHRAARGDAEGNFRRIWLLFALLEDALMLQGVPYEGPKEALSWLSRHAPDMREAFDAALKPGADIGVVTRLVAHVAGPAPVEQDTERELNSRPNV